MKKKNEEGVTLIIALIMLAVTTFISFAISTVIIREIGAARLILRTEPAISGANSGGEVGLYRLFRNLGGTTLNGTLPQSGASYTVVSNLYTNPITGYSFAAGANPITVGLYNAEDNTQNVAYRSIVVTTDDQPVKISVTSWDGTALSCDYTVSRGNPQTCTLTGPDYRSIISITRQGSNTANGHVYAYSGSGGTGAALGIPADSPTLDVTGTGNGVQRKIEVKLSTP